MKDLNQRFNDQTATNTKTLKTSKNIQKSIKRAEEMQDEFDLSLRHMNKAIDSMGANIAKYKNIMDGYKEDNAADLKNLH